MNLRKALELRKAKEYPVGKVTIHKDGTQWRKTKVGEWVQVKKGRKRRGINIKKINDGIKKAIKEKSGRLTHGYTVTNAFWILENGNIEQWNKKGITERERNLINVHSHSPENYKEHPKLKMDTFSGGDLWALRHMIKYGYGDTLVVIDAHGKMDIFKGSEKIGEFTRKQCEFERLLTREKYDEIAKKYKIPIKQREEKIKRMVLRQIAKDTGSTYMEKVRWKK